MSRWVKILPTILRLGKKITHISEIWQNFYPNSETKIKGEIKREQAKTPKFRACGGLNGKNNNLMHHFSVNNIILFTFWLKSPRSGEIFWEEIFGRKSRRKFFELEKKNYGVGLA